MNQIDDESAAVLAKGSSSGGGLHKRKDLSDQKTYIQRCQQRGWTTKSGEPIPDSKRQKMEARLGTINQFFDMSAEDCQAKMTPAPVRRRSGASPTPVRRQSDASPTLVRRQSDASPTLVRR